eukprot:TRINITY_DN11894_c0_g2_i1.p1 TRINITY_DN11894_c0_g2~~TRINITY_DN11894_c0_g2_i1.p1  ORF type:complete len:467 (+),score=63.29 TRINITY_DN11894_c0_g2_i1:60-1403(+)
MACGIMLLMIASTSQTLQGAKYSAPFKSFASDFHHLVDDEEAREFQKRPSSGALLQESSVQRRSELQEEKAADPGEKAVEGSQTPSTVAGGTSFGSFGFASSRASSSRGSGKHRQMSRPSSSGHASSGASGSRGRASGSQRQRSPSSSGSRQHRASGKADKRNAYAANKVEGPPANRVNGAPTPQFDDKSKQIRIKGTTFYFTNKKLGGGGFGETWLYSSNQTDAKDSSTIAVKTCQFPHLSRDACKQNVYIEGEDEEQAREEADHEIKIYTQLGCYSTSAKASTSDPPKGFPRVYIAGRLEGNTQSKCKQQHGTMLHAVRAGVEYDYWWLAMERMSKTLQDDLRCNMAEHQLEQKKQIASIALQVLDILRIIHEKKLVYRDLKSENLMYGMHDKKYQLHIVDMGLARERGDEKTLGTAHTLCLTVVTEVCLLIFVIIMKACSGCYS